METKHTPGPWEVRHHLLESTIRGDGYRLADVHQYGGIGSGKEVTRKANAQLMACSPELLSALIGLLEIAVGGGWSDEEYRERLRAEGGRHPDLVDPYADRVLAARAAAAKAISG